MKKIIIIIVVIIVAFTAWYLGSPLFLNTEVNEQFPVLDHMPTPEELEDMTQKELDVIENDVMDMAANQLDVIMKDPMPAKPVSPELITEGVFKGADNFHKGSGRAGIYRLSDGSRILRFEDFSVTNGPDLRVLLAEGTRPQSSSDLGEYIELAKLKGNKGDQNYEIPADADISSFASVVIYCKPFHVVFSTASLIQFID